MAIDSKNIKFNFSACFAPSAVKYSVILEYTGCPIMTLFEKTNPIICVFQPKTAISGKNKPNSNPIKPDIYPLRTDLFRRSPDLSRRSEAKTDVFVGTKTDLVAAFGHAVYSMAKNVGEK